MTLNTNDTVSASGTGDTATIQGTGDSLAIAAAQIGVADGASATISGAGDIIKLLGGAALTLAGTGERLQFASQPANATISGYDQSDMLQFSASTFANFNALLAHASQQGANTVIKTDATHSVVLSNTALSSLIQSRFTFA